MLHRTCQSFGTGSIITPYVLVAGTAEPDRWPHLQHCCLAMIAELVPLGAFTIDLSQTRFCCRVDVELRVHGGHLFLGGWLYWIHQLVLGASHAR